jgi:hypothetical protein
MRKFPECIPLVPPLRKREVQIERELAKYQAQGKMFPQALKELAAIRFYLQRALWKCQADWAQKHFGITNFAALLREIERWRSEASETVCFVTFNYDTMLEDAIALSLGNVFPDFSSYVSQTNYKLIKLHGSINWELSVSIPNPTARRIIASAENLGSDKTYHLLPLSPTVLDRVEVGFPAISIPVENKDDFNCPTEHVEALARCIPEVTRIVTVGWRASESHFLEMLRKPLTGLKGIPDLVIVSGSHQGAEETRCNLGIPENGRYLWIDSGFSGLINNLHQLEDFLRLPTV